MGICVTYASRRDEVWRWYWRMWRARLWRTHAAIFVSLAFGVSLALYKGPPNDVAGVCLIGAIAVAPLEGLALYPQLLFKPQTRTLVVDDEGVSTTVGRRSGRVPWSEILDVREENGTLVIQRRNLNAFLVPARAFASEAERSRFRDYVAERAPRP